jgi:predicted nucleic-acid-binding Zn-ribbon protein
MGVTKITYRCPECGSKDVIAEGALRWNEVGQCWDFTGDPYDTMTCLECDHDSDYAPDFEVEMEA